MLVAAILFFVMGVLSFALGFCGYLGFSLGAGTFFLTIFLFFSFISLVSAISTGKAKS